MMSTKIGIVEKIISEDKQICEIIVKINKDISKAIVYKDLTGNVLVGDKVLLNTTAVELNLGTGGTHFVICNLENPQNDLKLGGHIMKLRYTPFQLKVFAAEEQESKYHNIFNDFKSLENIPVLIGTLHSMVTPIVHTIKTLDPKSKIAYIMTDGAALPINLSKSINTLKKDNLIEQTITIGNAFGGDIECVNIYNGLIAAKEIVKADLIVVSMGPGITGTGTKYGFTGVEQGQIIDAVTSLGGRPIAVPRISFSDKRSRHKGISHHFITVLRKICNNKAYVPIVKYNDRRDEIIDKQLTNHGINEIHEICTYDNIQIHEILSKCPYKMSSMGRGFLEDKEYFISAAGSALLAIDLIHNQ